MERLFEVRESLLRFYTKYSVYVDKIVQFALALLTFGMIGSNIGFVKALSNPVVTLGLSVICAFLPMTLVVVIAAVVVIVQFYGLSMGVAIAAAVIFLLMFILYFRLAPDKSIVLLLMPLAFICKIPATVPIIFGLIETPVCVIPVILATGVHYMITYVKSYATTVERAGEKTELLAQITTFLRQFSVIKKCGLQWRLSCFAFLVVYNVKRLSVDNSWKIGIVAGALVQISVIAAGNVMMKMSVSYVELIVGAIVSVVIGIVLEFFVFAVDYSRTERLQFEDDEYFYYVKAVPKVYMSAPEKTVKRINERQGKKDPKKEPFSDDMLLEKALKDELEIQELLKNKMDF